MKKEGKGKKERKLGDKREQERGKELTACCEA